jgi:D-alanyl-D-alanine carboxypeptidase (penicillin-binding protein 5/6)
VSQGLNCYYVCNMEKTAERKPHKLLVLPVLILLIIAIYILWGATVAVPMTHPANSITWSAAKVPSVSLALPIYGQSAVGINSGVIASYGQQKPVPTASTAKLITALCVLQKYPLNVNEVGPTITLTAADVNLYDKYQAEDGSDVAVTAGEQLTEYQMLEAMLLPSADNIADSLAIWAFGSLPNYSTYANQYLKTSSLAYTHVGSDASGFDPSTTSTAADLVMIGEASMNNPVIASIVAKPSVSGFPVVGSIKNVNFLLGQDGIVGIKTGNTNQAGGVFVSASKLLVNQQPVMVYTALMQAPTLFNALHDSAPLITSAQANFSTPASISNVQKGTVVGHYNVPWSDKTILAEASQPIKIDSWGGTQITQTVNLRSISDKSMVNQVVGSITTSASLPKYSVATPVILSQSPGQPSLWWKLLHPFSLVHL